MGIFGIYGEKWKRFASYFPRFLALEERIEGRRAYYYLHEEEELLRKIQSNVAEHKVTKALKGIKRWRLMVAKSIEKQTQLGMGQIFQYFHILKITKRLIDALGKFIRHANTRPKGDTFRTRVDAVAEQMLKNMIAAIKEAEKWGGEDVRAMMAIINESRDKRPAEFIASVRTALKKQGVISRLGRIPLRIDIRKELSDERHLLALSIKLEAIEKELESGKKIDYDNMLGKFERILFEGRFYIADMFKAAHLIMKRDLILIMMVLSDERIMKMLGRKWVQVHFMPEMPIGTELMEINKLEKKLSEKAHTLANGMGVILKGERAIEQELIAELQQAAA